MRTLRLGWIAALLFTGQVCPAAAQVAQVPPGSVRGIFGGGSVAPGAQEFALTIDLDGGYDDNNVPDGNLAVEEFAPIQTGYVGAAAAALRYQKGSGDRYVVGTGSGAVNQQQIASGLPSFRLFSGEGSFQVGTRLGRRSGVTAGLSASYEPTYLFGAFSSLERNDPLANPTDGPPLPTEDASISLTQQRWVTGRAVLGVYRNWTSRQRMSLRYDGFRIRPLEGTGFESNRNTGVLYHVWDATQGVRLDLTYQYDDNPQVFEDLARALSTQTAEARVRYQHRLSPGRSLALMFGGGAALVRAGALGGNGSFEVAAPIASAVAEFDLTRIWRVALSARRDVTVLNGLSPEPFESDAAQLSLDGTVGRRLWVALSSGLSRGRGLRSDVGRYDLVMANAQVRYGLGAHVGLLLRYTYNEHEFRNVVVVPGSFPLRYSRNSIRVGLTMWFPLHGTF